ncbi:transcription-repair coupling factor [soil metagenome]
MSREANQLDAVEEFQRLPGIEEAVRRALAGGRCLVRGSVGSSTACLAGAAARISGRSILLMVAHVDDADVAEDELRAAGIEALRFPALETLPGESAATVELLAERLKVVERVLEAGTPVSDSSPPEPSQNDNAALVIVAPIQALMQGVPSAARLARAMLVLRAGQEIGPTAILKWLEAAGYRRVETVSEPGDYAPRGGILDIFPPGGGEGETAQLPAGSSAQTESNHKSPSASDNLIMSSGGIPVRLDFFGDQIERITEIDIETMGADRAVAGVRLVCASLETVQSDQAKDPAVNLLTLLPAGTIAVLAELMELTEQGRGYFERVTDARGIFGPPAVFQALKARCSGVIEVTALGQYASGERGEVIELPVQPVPPLDEDAGRAVGEIAALSIGQMAKGQRAKEDGGGDGALLEHELLGGTENPGARLDVTVYCQNAAERTRLLELLVEFGGGEHRVQSRVQFLNAGCIVGRADGSAALLLPYGELLHRFTVRRRAAGGRGGRLRAGRAMDTFLDLQPGDYVVHNEHGIALYRGLKFMKVGGEERTVEERLRNPGTDVKHAKRGKQMETVDPNAPDVAEFITLEFDSKALLHVPCMNADQVQKYIGGFKGKPQLSVLGGKRWAGQKERVKESVRDLAATLLRVRAGREAMPGIRYPADTAWQKEFEAEFPYEETEDQEAALAEIKKDMQSARPMDRLLCGDVGYGKTELAIRAAFKAVEYGKQVAVLVPTTVLAEQHERTFGGRFKDYPFRVASLSRFKTDAEIRKTLELVSKGQVDVVIGTHRLLSKDVQFADLGLVVIDEEQRFGVEHKEKLLALRMTVDVLTLSATPIPRTLHMSMLGLRDISSLATAPVDRRAVVTEVTAYNEKRLEQVVARELSRDGQVFFVHNRVHNIKATADDVQRLAPGARIVIGHGQMPHGELEKVMLTFMRREADILVSTTIIESGIDIPTANTMIINDADRFGLAELHQLRGRVGRSKHRGYCYLLLPQDRPLKEPAKQRLKAIEEYSMLGAGFKIAMRDLEIRGAGNILGPEQSGHIAAVGYDMYCQLLDRSVKELRNEVTAAPSETAVAIGVVGSIPKPYVPSDVRRLEAYRRLALAGTFDELRKVEVDLVAAYGALPAVTGRLFELAEVRIAARELGIRSIVIQGPDVILRTSDGVKTGAALRGVRGRVSVLPGGGRGGEGEDAGDGMSEVYFRPENAATLDGGTLLAVLRKYLGGVGDGVAVERVENAGIRMARGNVLGGSADAAREIEEVKTQRGMTSSHPAGGTPAPLPKAESGDGSQAAPALGRARRVESVRPVGLLALKGNGLERRTTPAADATPPALMKENAEAKRSAAKKTGKGNISELRKMMRAARGQGR